MAVRHSSKVGRETMATSFKSPSAHIEIQVAARAHVLQIQDLNAQWCGEQPLPSSSEGFISSAPFDVSVLHQIVEAGEAVVALCNGSVVGYYLLDNSATSNKMLSTYSGLISELTLAGRLPADRLSRRAQTAIHRDHHGKGLSRLMFDALVLAVKHRYDVLFTLVHKANVKLGAHERLGWRVVGESSGFWAVAYVTSCETPPDTSR